MQLDSAGLNAAIRRPEAPFGRNDAWDSEILNFPA